METWIRVIALSAGGVLGVNARYWLGVWMSRWTNPQFPWATFAINVSGSFAIGVLTVALARWFPHPNARLLVLTGFLGGYTTFSTFAYESVTLWERGERPLALLNVGGSVAAGLIAALLGIALAREVLIPVWERSARRDDQVGIGVLHPSPPDQELAKAGAGSTDHELTPDAADARLGGEERERS